MNIRIRFDTGILRWITAGIVISVIVWTIPVARAQQNENANEYAGLTGKELVDIHCTRCHLAPNPVDLPKELWPVALHWMGNYVGMQGDEFADFSVEPADYETGDDYTKSYALVDTEGNRNGIRIFNKWVLPEPSMMKAEWLQIREYFVVNARPKSDMIIRRSKQPLITGFTPSIPPLDLEPNGLIFTTLVDEDNRRLYVGRGVLDDWVAGGRPGFEGSDDLLAFDLNNGRRVGYSKLATDPMDLELTATGVRVSTHGEFPIEYGNGRAQIIDWEGFDSEQPRARMLVNGIHRITQHHTHDLNDDGLDDILITGFGDGILQNAGGRLSVFWQTPGYADQWQSAPAEIPSGPLQGALRETVLLQRAGMISSAIADFDRDGLPDILVLTAQAQQQVLLFINQGDESFTEHEVLEYTPSFGGISLEVADFNDDGHMDFLLMNGNNVEMVTLRPQHGLRIYESNGDLTFTQRFSYPMHGATKSVINDFDSDGDLDIATISLWPDWDLDEPETFVYLENQGDWQFEPMSLDTPFWGIWLSIEVGDVNADQKPDIVLGLGNYPALVPSDWTTRKIMADRNGAAPSVIFLLNDH